jgi:8-oxo-dGTP pyrophosphatase MutT (NUDIX family)
MQTALVVKALIVNARDEVLIMRRSATDTNRPGGPDMPGGTAEDGELITDTVEREVSEEAGLHIPPQAYHLLHAATTVHGDGNKIRFVFAARVKKPAVRLSFEHDRYEWLPLAEAIRRFGDHPWATALRHIHDNRLLPELDSS